MNSTSSMHRASAGLDVTVIVTTYNRAAGLAAALDGLMSQRVSAALRYEVLVIDDGSTDETPTVLREAQERSFIVRSMRIANSGVSKARDVGVRNAHGAWIAFCDDDQIPSPQWVESLYHVAVERNAACVGGPVSLLLPSSVPMPLSPNARRLLGEDDFGAQVREYPGGAHPGTGNVMVRRDVFDRLGGFDGTFAEGGEDAEFFRRVRDAGLLILYVPSAEMQHVIPPSRLRPEFFRWVARRIGVADARIHHKHASGWRTAYRMSFRLAVLAVRDAPTFVTSGVHSARRLDAMCSMQYTFSFIRGTASFVAPRVFGSSAFIKRLHFTDHGGERSVSPSGS